MAFCPNKECGVKIPLLFGPTEGMFDPSTGWGRCENCKLFMHKDHLHCMGCGHQNPVAKENTERVKRAQLLKRQAQDKKDAAEKDEKIRRQNEELEDLRQILQQKEDAEISAALAAVERDDDAGASNSGPTTGTSDNGGDA